MKKTDETTIYAQMGMAALLPGMKYMLERMQSVVAEMENLLAHLQGGGEVVKHKPARKTGSGSNTWAGMTAEERSIEMRRRFQVRAEKKAAKAKEQVKSSASDTKEELRKKFSAAKKRSWKKKSPEQREAWLKAMKAGRAKAEKQRRKAQRAAISAPLVTMEKTA